MDYARLFLYTEDEWGDERFSSATFRDNKNGLGHLKHLFPVEVEVLRSGDTVATLYYEKIPNLLRFLNDLGNDSYFKHEMIKDVDIWS